MRLDIENLISITLRTGVFVSIAVILAGVIFTFAHHPAYFSSRPALGDLIDAREHYTSSIRGVAEGVRAFHGQAIVMLGILLLIATPIIRVAISVFLFAAERDRRYVVITAAVLVLLLISLVTGLGE